MRFPEFGEYFLRINRWEMRSCCLGDKLFDKPTDLKLGYMSPGELFGVYGSCTRYQTSWSSMVASFFARSGPIPDFDWNASPPQEKKQS